jgi:hypothetical protein
MKCPAFALTRLLGVVALASVLAACGSGDSSEDPPPTGFARINCTVTSDQGAVAAATVSFQTTDASGVNKKYETQTDSDGTCKLDMPLAEVSGVDLPAGTVVKAGYEPQTLICYGFSKSEVSCKAEVRLIVLAGNVSIPLGSDTVWHIGDSNFQGQPNSQLQKRAPDGAALEFPIADWDLQVKKEGVTRATVVLDHKGWQTSICPDNSIALVGDAGSVALAGANSSEEGYWSGGTREAKPFVFQVAQVGLTSAKVVISAGSCRGTDLDDFEINRMRVYFCGADGPDCIPRLQ